MKLCSLSTQLATLAIQLASLLLNTSGSAHSGTRKQNREPELQVHPESGFQIAWCRESGSWMCFRTMHIVAQSRALPGATGVESLVQTHGQGELCTRGLKAGMARLHDTQPRVREGSGSPPVSHLGAVATPAARQGPRSDVAPELACNERFADSVKDFSKWILVVDFQKSRFRMFLSLLLHLLLCLCAWLFCSLVPSFPLALCVCLLSLSASPAMH